MNHLLDNPVYNALLSGDAHLGRGSSTAKYFYEEVSPFAGFAEDDPHGFNELYNLLPAGRKILFATRKALKEVPGWQLTHKIIGLQFVFTGTNAAANTTNNSPELIPLESKHVEEMTTLARLTKPGPFDKRTIDFGHYYGIFDNNKLAAMTGQRLHVENYTEISAVCTYPDHLGKGYAAALIQHQLNLICDSGKIPFLHVREDNKRAIGLYLRLGFTQNGPMNFYFLKRN